jgi:hypothetical protein
MEDFDWQSLLAKHDLKNAGIDEDSGSCQFLASLLSQCCQTQPEHGVLELCHGKAEHVNDAAQCMLGSLIELLTTQFINWPLQRP